MDKDFEHCERLIAICLTKSQKDVLKDHPRWDCNPPQRENYEDAASYVTALGDYADRVICEERALLRKHHLIPDYPNR